MLSPLELTIASVLLFLSIALLAPILAFRRKYLVTISFVASAAASLLAAAAGFLCVSSGSTGSMTLPIGLPDRPFYIRLDPCRKCPARERVHTRLPAVPHTDTQRHF